MKRVCAWCGNLLSEDTEGDGLVSHGICLVCVEKVYPEQPVPLQNLIDRLDVPVFVVDGDVTVSLLNKCAQETLGISPEQAAHRRGGEVFDCIYSRLPGGCGRSIHCAACALRMAITATCQTGEPQVQVPAILKRSDPDDPSSVTLTVTTIKRGDLVIVKIDKIG